MKIVAGLGNPLKKYDKTRHNVGFMFIDYLKNKYNITQEKENHNSKYFEVVIDGEKVIFIKPLTYMNLSGTAILSWLKYYSLTKDDLFVIHDDKDMNLGKIKIIRNSSSGGHNGIKNIEELLKTKDYLRLKIGINSEMNENTKDFVLENFSKEELGIIYDKFSKLENVINSFIHDDYLMLTSKYNGK